jgi:hypothetical protein
VATELCAHCGGPTFRGVCLVRDCVATRLESTTCRVEIAERALELACAPKGDTHTAWLTWCELGLSGREWRAWCWAWAEYEYEQARKEAQRG